MNNFMNKNKNILKVVASCIFNLNLKIEPILIEIDVTNKCNLKCLMCPNKKMIRKKDTMDLSIFKEVINQTSDTAREYSLGIYGEPTLHPDLAEMIEFIKKKGNLIALNTNLNYHDDALSEQFVREKVDRVIVTMCGVDKATYEAISLNGDYNLLINNLIKINEMKKKLKSRKPVLVGYFTKMKLNANLVNKARIELKKYFDYCYIARMHDWAVDKDITSLKIPQATCINNKCTVLWTAATVLCDGRVAACCQDYEGKIILGDAKKTSIKDIWNSSKIKEFRKDYLNSQLCKGCSYPKRFQFSAKNLGYILRTTV